MQHANSRGATRRAPEPPAAGRFDTEALALAQRPGGLAWQRPPVERVAPAGARLTPRCAGRAVAAALGDEREAHLLERFELAHDAIAAAVASGAARAAAHGVAHHAHGKFALQRLDRRVERVAHGHVHRAGAVGVRAAALASTEGLVVGEARAAE